jgi:hypothetical protein
MNLAHFDTILAFVAVMAGLSLAITSLTQAVSGLLGLRGFTNLASGTNWLVAQCSTHGVTNSARWLEKYQALVPQAALRQAADTMQTLLENQLTLGVISSYGPGESWWSAIRSHLGGVVLSIALLSLGAPFWFNLLRSLSNLRPVLATKDSQEQQARVKAIAAGKAAGGGNP